MACACRPRRLLALIIFLPFLVRMRARKPIFRARFIFEILWGYFIAMANLAGYLSSSFKQVTRRKIIQSRLPVGKGKTASLQQYVRANAVMGGQLNL